MGIGEAIIDRLKFVGHVAEMLQTFLLMKIFEVVRTGFDTAAKTPQSPEFSVQSSGWIREQAPGSPSGIVIRISGLNTEL